MDNEVIESIAEEEEVRKALGLGYPEVEEKVSVLQFLKDIVSSLTNVKTGNLTDDELGDTRIPVRTNIELASYCKFMGLDAFSKVFEADAQITLATSLSRRGFLPILAVTTKKDTTTSLSKIAGAPAKKKGFFAKKPEGTT